jgi:AcrR family transcriptional regulator
LMQPAGTAMKEQRQANQARKSRVPTASTKLARDAHSMPPDGLSLGLKGTRTRRRIMDATAEAMAERSFADLRITDIARAAQIAQPNFYTYFASVEDVIQALSEEVSFEGLARYLEPDWSAKDGIQLARRLIKDAFALWERHHAIIALTWFLADKRYGDFPKLRVRQVRCLYKAFEVQIRKSQDAGRIARAIEPRLAGYECVGLIASAAGKYLLLRESGFSHKQLIETNARLVHMIATGIATPHDP